MRAALASSQAKLIDAQKQLQEALGDLAQVHNHLLVSATDLTGIQAVKADLEQTQVRERLAF